MWTLINILKVKYITERDLLRAGVGHDKSPNLCDRWDSAGLHVMLHRHYAESPGYDDGFDGGVGECTVQGHASEWGKCGM